MTAHQERELAVLRARQKSRARRPHPLSIDEAARLQGLEALERDDARRRREAAATAKRRGIVHGAGGGW